VFWDTLAPKKRIIRPAPVKKLISSKDKIKWIKLKTLFSKEELAAVEL
jgi:hypothetical protein